MSIDTDTVLAMAGLILATNVPFYVLSLQNYRFTAWIKEHCRVCKEYVTAKTEQPDSE